jgi:hypothetical protein
MRRAYTEKRASDDDASTAALFRRLIGLLDGEKRLKTPVQALPGRMPLFYFIDLL